MELGDRGHLNVIDQSTGFKIDIYPAGDDPLVKWGFENKKRVELIEGEQVWVAPPEYVILKKLVYYNEGGSQKHLEDIRGIMEVYTAGVDITVVKEWCKKLNLVGPWEEVSKT